MIRKLYIKPEMQTFNAYIQQPMLLVDSIKNVESNGLDEEEEFELSEQPEENVWEKAM